MNRFIKSSLLVGALLAVTGVSFSAPAQADNNQQKYLNNLAVQMYANNVANGMNPMTGGIYSPYVQAAINGNNNNRRHHRHRNDNCYYNNNYGYQPYGYGAYGNGYGYGNAAYGYNGYNRPSVFGQLLNGFGY